MDEDERASSVQMQRSLQRRAEMALAAAADSGLRLRALEEALEGRLAANLRQAEAATAAATARLTQARRRWEERGAAAPLMGAACAASRGGLTLRPGLPAADGGRMAPRTGHPAGG